MEQIMAISLIVGFVNVVQMTFPQVKGLWAFLVALVMGLIIGQLKWFGVTGLEMGVLYAFVSSGIYKLTTNPRTPSIGQPNL